MRILALDLGRRRIGLALSDELGVTAQGLPTLQRKNNRTDLAALGRVLKVWRDGQIVVDRGELIGPTGARSA